MQGRAATEALPTTANAGDEDARLVQLARKGDQDAMDSLVRRHYKSVFNLAYRLCNNYDDAHDIVSEAFIRVYNALPNFRGDAHFTTWLYRIVRNVFLDERKKRRIRNHSSLEDLVELEDSSVARQVEDPRPGPASELERGERSTMVQEAVLELPELQRLMIGLYHFQHCSYEEIAEVMELPIGTVKSRLNRARLALKNKLSPTRELLEG